MPEFVIKPRKVQRDRRRGGDRVWVTVTVRDTAGKTREVVVPRGSAFADRPLPQREAPRETFAPVAR